MHMNSKDPKRMDKRDAYLLSGQKSIRSYFDEIPYADMNYFKEIFSSSGKIYQTGLYFI